MIIPIVLFAYARPDHLRRTLACLRENRVPLIYAYCDAPASPDKAALVEEVRRSLRAIDWCELLLTERDVNWGLGRSILAGVTEVLEQHEACVVFEDDLISVPGSYAWLCEALRRYRDETRVMSVSAWTHPLVTPTDVADQPYFDGRADCWGWGTWARAWQGMNDQTAREMMVAAETRGIDRSSYGGDLPAMAETEQQRNIWAVRLLYHHLARGGLCLRPPWSMVEHIGFDGRATNAGSPGKWENPPLRSCPPVPTHWPEPIEHPGCAPLHRAATAVEHVSQRSFTTRVGSRARRALWRIAVRLAGMDPSRSITVRDVGRQMIPPAAIHFFSVFPRLRLSVQGALRGSDQPSTVGLVGDYANWADAKVASKGYGSDLILEKTLESIRKVKRGEAVYERDSVLFDQIEYAWPVLAGLVWVAAQRGGPLNVLDFGGSLGSSYFQNRAFLDRLDLVRWNIVEQARHVEVGQREFQDERLRFYNALDVCLRETTPDVVLLSSVLQYLEDPYDVLDKLNASSCPNLIIDRTPFWEGSFDRVCVQHVPQSIYAASYPSWIFSARRFRAILGLHWHAIADFASPDALTAPVPTKYRGLIALRRDEKAEPSVVGVSR